MSHFSVAVFSRDPSQVDELLAPYNECVEKGSPYAEFKESEHGSFDPDKHAAGYWYNPHAKWDWWCIGGRWSGMLRLKEGRMGMYEHCSLEIKQEQIRNGVCDQALASDCDFSPNEKARSNALRIWEIAVEKQMPDKADVKQYGFIYQKEYYLDQYGTKERFADAQSKFLPYAAITEDGKWLATADMWWWGLDNATREGRETYESQFATYLEHAIQERLYITIVDCHI